MTLQKKLLLWFEKYSRPLPWRSHYRPYEVWISEIMLQQTQMDTVLPYFDRWIKTFPDIATLANSSQKKVLKLWEGLGYYSRARHLHANAKLIIKNHNGIFPKDYETILSLKGIGRYTAGAISSIAFNEEKPIVDGNVLRVLSRIYAIKEPIDVPKYREKFWSLQESLIPKGQARLFNQALMELGALVCTSQNPSCPACPIRKHCRALKQGDPESYPIKINKKKMVKVQASAVALEKNGKLLLLLRPVGKIMGGLWEFPEWKLSRNQTLSQEKIKKLTMREIQKEFGLVLKNAGYLGTIKRNYTHHLEIMHVFHAKLEDPLNSIQSTRGWESFWSSKKDFKKMPFSAAHAKITRLL